MVKLRNWETLCKIPKSCNFLWDGFGRWTGTEWKPFNDGDGEYCSNTCCLFSLREKIFDRHNLFQGTISDRTISVCFLSVCHKRQKPLINNYLVRLF